MSRFEYLSVLLSIVIAYAMSHVLSGWGRASARPDQGLAVPIPASASSISTIRARHSAVLAV